MYNQFLCVLNSHKKAHKDTTFINFSKLVKSMVYYIPQVSEINFIIKNIKTTYFYWLVYICIFPIFYRTNYLWNVMWYSKLRIQHCHRSGFGCCCGEDLISGPGISVCHKYNKKEQIKQIENSFLVQFSFIYKDKNGVYQTTKCCIYYSWLFYFLYS